MYGTEINIKITDFDDTDELEEIVAWITNMINKNKLKRLEEEQERAIRRTTSKKKAVNLLTLDTIEEETIGGEDLTENKEVSQEKKDSESPRIQCECGVEFVKKNKNRHEQSKSHLKYIQEKH